MYQALHIFASLTASLAGLSIGLSAIIITYYWRIWRAAKNGARLLPAHVMGIGLSYSMLALIAVVRINEVPPPVEVRIWWVYPFISAAFLLGDVALGLILLFLRSRGQQQAS